MKLVVHDNGIKIDVKKERDKIYEELENKLREYLEKEYTGYKVSIIREYNDFDIYCREELNPDKPDSKYLFSFNFHPMDSYISKHSKKVIFGFYLNYVKSKFEDYMLEYMLREKL
jgi:hypothetical protein